MKDLAIWDQMKRIALKAGQSEKQGYGSQHAEGPEEFREGEKTEEEAELVEVDLEEEGVLQQPAHPWTLDRPTPRALFDNIVDGWRWKENFDYSYQGDNRYLVHFECEADMARILRGGPWQYKHDPLIIEAYDGMRKVSEYILDRIRIWVRILDVPTN